MDGSLDAMVSRSLLCDATASLIGIAASIDCLSESNRSMELLEARLAIHNALVAMAEWRGSLEGAPLARAAI